MKSINQDFSMLFYLLSASFVVAFFSHLFFLSEWFHGRYMAGIGDGIGQILPIKQLLYEEYTNGNFFYSTAFGLGGGIYSQLGYYFSTSTVFIFTVLITFCLESAQLIHKPDLFYWADIILVISIIRMTLIIMFASLFFRYIHFRVLPAFIGASLYGTSVIYFRHVVFWEFFVDAMLWLPLLLFGVEKIIREKKVGWFIFAVSISLVNNFYFSYINFLFIGLYIVFRWLIPLIDHEAGKIVQVKMYILSGLAAFSISAVAIIPVVSGYLHNFRPPYEDKIPFYEFTDNLLWNGKIIILPAFVVLSLFVLSFYKERLFRLFACLTILLSIMHFSPMVASAFNGFSAPQYRWEYILSFVAGGAVAAALQQMDKVNIREAGASIIGAVSLYILLIYLDTSAFFALLKKSVELFAAAAIVILFGFYSWKKNKQLLAGLAAGILISSIYLANQYQEEKLSNKGNVKEVSKALMLSDAYNGKDQRALIEKIKEQESDPFARIDWMLDTRNNTPIVQNFNGFSVYSSILNKHLLFFYLFDLEIDMGRESVSRYASLGDRANLYSILEGKYYIEKKGKTSIPYGFEEIFTSGNYIAYKNKYCLPFVRTTDKVFYEDQFVHASPVAKERAMLEGIMLKEGNGTDKDVPESVNKINEVTVKAAGASYQGDVLSVTDEKGGVDLIINNSSSTAKDYYISFYLKSLEDKDRDEFTLTVNDYVTTRKTNHSIYKTNVNDLTIRVQKANKISIRIPKGKYKLANFELYEEDYRLLESIKKETDRKPNVPVNFSGNNINISYNNITEQKYMILPVPFEKGWHVYVNGKKQQVHQANYAFTGIELNKGKNEIKLVYYPPYFRSSLFITISSLLIVFVFLRRGRSLLK
ncbi:YfhO family protein [Niallia sp. 01092]|uniref:YfhO family protein n=1 Tax=unclassified Niallia TaxID=2837522 RepID=UPI003FD442E8